MATANSLWDRFADLIIQVMLSFVIGCVHRTSHRVYTGEFRNHKRHGVGVLKKRDGSCYDGEWKDDIQEGKGKYTSAEGKKYKVVYKTGRLVKKT